jgi:hypothetical protein
LGKIALIHYESKGDEGLFLVIARENICNRCDLVVVFRPTLHINSEEIPLGHRGGDHHAFC